MTTFTIRKYHIIFLLLLFLCGGTDLYSSNDSLKKHAIVFDTSRVQVRQPPEAQQKLLLENKDYKYDRVGPAPKGLWDRFKEWLGHSLDDLSNTEGGKVGITIFQYCLIIAVIVIIIVLLLKNDIRAVFYGKSASVKIDFKEFDEDIHNINFDDLISAAVNTKDYRKAVRLHFLKLLKDLTDNNLISWQIDKTNNDYSIELKNSKYAKSFSELSLMYEYIWYGDFHLDENNFSNTISKFKAFKVTR
ncbi:MAG: hypothetical protein ACJ77K_15170 [Bacteroidia bacterium]